MNSVGVNVLNFVLSHTREESLLILRMMSRLSQEALAKTLTQTDSNGSNALILGTVSHQKIFPLIIERMSELTSAEALGKIFMQEDSRGISALFLALDQSLESSLLLLNLMSRLKPEDLARVFMQAGFAGCNVLMMGIYNPHSAPNFS